MRTCIYHKEYSQAMSRYQICSISRESPIRYGLRGPWKHPQRVPTLSKEGLGSCAQQTNPKPALDRFGWQHKSPWWYSVRCRHHNYLVRFRKNNYLVRFRVKQKAFQAKTSLGRVGLVRHRHISICNFDTCFVHVAHDWSLTQKLLFWGGALEGGQDFLLFGYLQIGCTLVSPNYAP